MMFGLKFFFIFHLIPSSNSGVFQRYGFRYSQTLISLTNGINSTIYHSHGHQWKWKTIPKVTHSEEFSQLHILIHIQNLYLIIKLGFLLDFYECDPLTQKWDLLPPSPPREDDFAVSGIVCNYQFCSSSVISKSYKVIRIPNFAAAANEFTVEIFSSDLGEWKIYDVSCPQYVTWDIDYFYGNLFTHNGVFYWFQQRNRKILAVIVNGNTNHGTSGPKCRMIKMPGEAVDGDIKHLSECLGESEGLICFARFQETEMSLSA